MPVRRRPSAAIDPAIVRDAHRQLVQCGSKAGLVSALQPLAAAGVRTEAAIDTHTRGIRRRLESAQRDHACAPTPYGPVVQTMELPSSKLKRWEYCNPMALLWYLCSISIHFGELMASALAANIGRLKFILYIDEIGPGNPLRPDKSRTLQAIYWAIVE